MYGIDEDSVGLIDYPNLTGTPERRLLLAILERAILDFVGNDAKERDEADAWIFEEESDERIEYSFAWICHHLDLSLVSARRSIRAMPKRGSRRVAPWYFSAAN